MSEYRSADEKAPLYDEYASGNIKHGVDPGHEQLAQQPQRRSRPLVNTLLAIALLACGTILHMSTWRIESRRCPASVVDQVLKEVPLIDGHNDLPYAARMLYGNHLYDGQFKENASLPGQVDFPRLRKGRLGGQFWSIYNACPEPSEIDAQAASKDPFPNELYLEGQHEILQQIDVVKRLITMFPNNLVAATSSKDVWSNYRQSKLPISSLMGIEGLHSIGNSPSALRMYHQLGVRYVTLTHFCNNRYADSGSQPPHWHGISEDGKKIIKEMNRIGMAVDLAHTSPDTMRQTLDFTDVPVMFSHASAYGVCPHERNVPDDVLHKVKKNGGVVMITFVNDYVNCKNPKEASIEDVADHVQYVGKLIGYEHVGIGSDFDGMLTAPKGLEDVSKYPELLKILVERGVTKDELKGVVGGNILRVLKAIEDATEDRHHEYPLEDDLPML